MGVQRACTASSPCASCADAFGKGLKRTPKQSKQRFGFGCSWKGACGSPKRRKAKRSKGRVDLSWPLLYPRSAFELQISRSEQDCRTKGFLERESSFSGTASDSAPFMCLHLAVFSLWGEVSCSQGGGGPGDPSKAKRSEAKRRRETATSDIALTSAKPPRFRLQRSSGEARRTLPLVEPRETIWGLCKN